MIEIDGYSGISRIGHGGLGDVYKATRDSTGGTVAIKVLRDVSDESIAWNRTRRELTALVALAGHANVIQLIELLDLPQGPAMVMEYAPGGSVAELMQRRDATLTVGETVLVGQHVAAALVAAHEQGIVHRDIKPQNLLIDAYGQVKLCDFGIATLMRSDDFRSRTSALSMRYASPEDLDDEADVGPSSDVYSLGATLLHLARGAPPTMRERMAEWQPPETDDPDAAALDLVIASCLRPAPADRPDAAAVLDELEQLAWSVGERQRALVFDPPTVLPEPEEEVTDPRPGAGAAVAGGVAAAAGASKAAEAPESSVPVVEAVVPPVSGDVVPPVEDDTVHRPRAAPPRPPAPPPPEDTRRGWLVAGVAGVAALAIGLGVWMFWPDGSEEDASTTTAATTAATTTPSTTSTTTTTTETPTTTLQLTPLVVTPRPADLPPLTDAVWPFGAVGECLVQQADESELMVIGCGEPHDLQRFDTGALDNSLGADPSAFTAIVSTEVDRLCREAFDEFVGRPVDESDLQFATTQPSPGTWLEDDRRYQCLLGVADERVEGDARDSEW